MSEETQHSIYHHIDLYQASITKELMQAPIYVGGQIVSVRSPLLNIAVERTWQDGQQNAALRVVREGDLLVASDQEQRLVSDKTFRRQYRQLADGLYMRVDLLVRAFQNPISVPVIAIGPDGADITGGKDCMFAMAIGDNPRAPTSHRGFIAMDEFIQACRPYEEVFGYPFEQRPRWQRATERLHAIPGLGRLAGFALRGKV